MTGYRLVAEAAGGCPTLESDRLILRPLRDDDLDPAAAMMATPEVRASLHLPESFGRYDTWAGLAMWRGQWALRGTGHWALEEKAGGTFVGRAGTHRPPRPDWPGLEIGWCLHPDHWGAGYATEAGRVSIEWAFETLEVDEVVSVILEENTRSAAVAERLGFRPAELRTLSHFPDIPHRVWRLPKG